MSGLELFLDGGATFAGLLSAGAAVVGYKQQKEDDSELVEDEELEILRKNLSEATTSACAAHTALTVAWGQPLSLFKGDMSQISWAIEAVDMAKGLVELAAELEDLADVYDAQLHLAISKRRSLLRWPLGRLEAKLEEMQLVLTAQIPAVVLAKEAMAFGTKAMKPVQAETAIEAARSFGSFDQGAEKSLKASTAEELPLAILQDRQLLGELWRVGPGRMEVLARAIARRTGRMPPESPAEDGKTKETPDYSSYVADYL